MLPAEELELVSAWPGSNSEKAGTAKCPGLQVKWTVTHWINTLFDSHADHYITTPS